MRVDPKTVATILPIAKKVVEFARSKDVRELASEVWSKLGGDEGEKGTGHHNDALVVSRTLHRLEARKPPQLALAGLTSSGKSTLLNTLFGVSVADVKRTADTTDCVICVPFRSGLVIYDTPGFAGNETFENVARAFLRIPQDPDLGEISSIPILALGQTRAAVDLSSISASYPIDAVIFLLDLERTISRFDKKAIRATVLELEQAYESRLMIVGTHLDRVRDLPERDLLLSSFQALTDNRMTAVSSLTGEGLDALTQRIFPGTVSLSALQETLLAERKASRLEFVVAEAAAILAEVALLDGKSVDDLRAYIVVLYVRICHHYSVDEVTWLRLNGDLDQIHEHVSQHGVSTIRREREASGFLEWFRSTLFGTKFFTSALEFRRLGTAGLAELAPRIYGLIYDLAGVTGQRLSDPEIASAFRASEGTIDPLVTKEDAAGIGAIVGETMLSLLGRTGVAS
jgi:GTP-binding protein EngB required for normal cell division